MAEYIYQMIHAYKRVGDKTILDDVTTAFYPGTEIGMVDPNDAGKSTILKIMAGLDEPSNGEVHLPPGYLVGILPQEPPLDDGKMALKNAESGRADMTGKLRRFNEIGEEMADPDANFDTLMEEMGKFQTEIDAVGVWDLDAQL